MATEETFSIASTLKNGTPQDVPFSDMKEAVLGARYELSLIFVGERRARTLHRMYHYDDTPANVLAFPYTANEGEIVICPHEARRQAPFFEMSATGFVGYLFIHGCLHLKGYDHGSTMTAAERAFVKQFALS
jgi:probable rRNA maturation factor